MLRRGMEILIASSLEMSPAGRNGALAHALAPIYEGYDDYDGYGGYDGYGLRNQNTPF